MMEFSIGSGGSEQEASNSRKGKKPYHRHTSHQIQRLEAFFKECPHPDENQRRQLSRELGLETKQIKFWFQNKRTQTKAQNERSDNTVLRSENERIHCENLAIKEALKNVICPSCGGPPFGEEERQLSLQKLQLENAQLKEEHEKVSNLLAKYIGKPIESLATVQAIPMELLSPGNNPMNQGIGSSTTPGLDLDLSSGGAHSLGNFNCNSSNIPTYHFRAIPDLEKALMAETATGAMAELVRLLQFDDPLWIKSPATDGRYALHRDTYDNIFPRANHFKTTSARFESSKDSAVVILNAMHLIDLFMDSNKWSDLFPSIITKAKTVQVLEDGMLGSRNGALQLMYEQMHMLSPLVPQREFYILRNCQQIDQGMWVIADVSYDFSNVDPNISLSRAWKLPSGCLIQEMPNGCSKVTWVEHVEVDDKTQTHRLYRDLICNAIAYGAQRWVVTLQRMSERMAYSLSESAPPCEFGVITSLRGRRSVMQLSHRMVKNFCEMLSMAGKLDFPQLSEVNNSGVRVSVRNSTQVGQPCGLIVSAATSLWLPLPPQTVFNFFRDEKNRLEWDILSNSNQVNEIAHISVGAHPGNCISIIRPFIPTESNMVMLQETSIDSLGSMLIYAPIDIPALTVAIKGENPSTIPVLPSGFIISSDGRSDHHHSTTSATPGSSASSSSNNMIIAGKSSSSSGSLLTVAFQILVSSPNASKQLNMESVATVNTLISSTVQRIKAALNCSNLD